jgi:hypothetical protein
MTIIIHDAFINALLADAAYVEGLKPSETGDDLEADLSKRMTPRSAA